MVAIYQTTGKLYVNKSIEMHSYTINQQYECILSIIIGKNDINQSTIGMLDISQAIAC